MDDFDQEKLKGPQSSRGYADFFDWPLDRDLAEFGVVESLAKSLEHDGKTFFTELAIRGRGNDPPDLEAVDTEGRCLAIEVTELVDGLAISEHKKGRTKVKSEWHRESFLDRVEQILAAKHGRFPDLKGGPYLGGYVVVIHSDETFLNHLVVEEFLMGRSFADLPNIGRAFLLLSYFPGKGYPYFELRLT